MKKASDKTKRSFNINCLIIRGDIYIKFNLFCSILRIYFLSFQAAYSFAISVLCLNDLLALDFSSANSGVQGILGIPCFVI